MRDRIVTVSKSARKRIRICLTRELPLEATGLFPIFAPRKQTLWGNSVPCGRREPS